MGVCSEKREKMDEAWRVEHGSIDSVDLDCCYLIRGNEMPASKTLDAFCKEKRGEDVNVALVGDSGFIVDCMRGLPSETHNALLATVPLRGPMTLLPTFFSSHTVPRNAHEKLLDTLQKLTIMVRRSGPYRDKAISCLKSNQVAEMVALVTQVDFSQTSLDVDAIKQCAFIVAQTLELLSGTELYTKSALAEARPELRNMLFRDPNADTAPLSAAVKLMLESVGGTLKQHQSFVLFIPGSDGGCKHFMSVFAFEKNRVRLLFGATSRDAEYIRVSDALIVSRAPPHWKVEAKVRKQCEKVGVYNESCNLLG